MTKKLILFRREIFCLLLSIAIFTGTWMNAIVKTIREKGVKDFSIMDLEYPKSDIALYATVKQLQIHQAIPDIIRNLKIDYVFMPAAYLGIAVWLLMLRLKGKKWMLPVLTILAILQAIPWLFDILENNHLLKVVQGNTLTIPLDQFKFMVRLKFIISLSGAGIALLITLGQTFLSKWFNHSN